MIRKATSNDINAIETIYNTLHTNEENGLVTIGWDRSIYPTRATALEALENEDLFVLEAPDHQVVAAARINQIQVPEYADADWHYKDISDDQVMVLHTLVVDPDTAGKGYGTEFVHFYEEYARSHDCPYLRMDTNEKNAAARKLYKKLGYWESDIVPCTFNGIEGVQLVCLEKYLNP